MSRFITSIWKQQAILRTLSSGGETTAKISRDWLPLESGGVSSGRGNGQARLYYNVYTARDKWFRSAHKSKAVLHIDGSGGVADPIPVGEAGTDPLLVMRAQLIDPANDEDDVHLTTEFSNPPEVMEERVKMDGVYDRLVWYIQAQGLYDYRPAGLAMNLTVGGRKRERAPSSPTKLKFESISKGFFKNGASNGRLGVPEHDLTTSSGNNSNNSHRRTRSLVSKSSGTFGSMNSAVTSTPATSVEHGGSFSTRPPSPLPKSPGQPAFERKVKRKQTPPSQDAEREAAHEMHVRAQEQRRVADARLEEERLLAVRKAEEEVDMLNYRDRVRASYLERPRSVPPPSTSASVEDEDGEDEVEAYLRNPMRSRSSLATIGNYSIRSDASTSVPWGSETEAHSSDATNGNGSTISNSTSVDLKFSENGSSQFPRYEDADEDMEDTTLERQPSYVPGGADEATVGGRTESSGSRRRSSSLPTHSHESVSSSLIPPEPAFSMSRQTTNSSVWSRSTGTSSATASTPSMRKPFGPRHQTNSTSSRNTAKSTPRAGNAYRMDLPVVRPLSIPSKNVAAEAKPQPPKAQPAHMPSQKSVPEDGYGYTDALDEWVYNDSAEKENKDSRMMPPPKRREIVKLDVGLSERKRKWEEICHGAGTSDDSLNFLIDSVSVVLRVHSTADVMQLSDDARVLKKTKSGEIDNSSFGEMEKARDLEIEVARQLQQRLKSDAERTYKIEKQLSECKSEISVLYESFNEELDGMYADVHAEDAVHRMARDLSVAKAQRNEYLKISTELKQQLDLLL